MTITQDDIKLQASERMTDASDGGGRMTGNEIIDNVPGNLFPKISRIDAVYGRVNMRKFFVSVRTATSEVYAGAHLILSEPPTNPRVSAVLFDTGSHFDERTAAKDRVESYVIKGPRSVMHPVGTQLAGQRVISAYQRMESSLPDVGDVYALSVESGSYDGQIQYVRIMAVEHEERIYSYQGSGGQILNMTRRAVTLEISQALTADFPGEDPSPLQPGNTVIRETNVADTAHYFGIQPLTSAANVGDLTIQAQSIFSPLVPGSTTETPVVDVSMSGTGPYVPSGSGTWIYDAVGEESYSLTLDLSQIELPANVDCQISEGVADTIRMEISATGDVVINDFTVDLPCFDVTNVSFDLDTRQLSFEVSNTCGELDNIKLFGPYRTQVSEVAQTRNVEITLATRGLNYVETLRPIPAPGTLLVSYRAQGRWYDITDTGDGTLDGAGVGTVSYATGATLVTLDALPDVGSAVLYQWGTPAHFTERTAASVPRPAVSHDLGEPVVPGTFALSWLEATVTKNATASVSGAISGDGATGYLVHSTGGFYVEFAAVPDAGSSLQVDWDRADIQTEILTGLTPNGGHVSFTLANLPIKPGSLSCEWQIQHKTISSSKLLRNVFIYTDSWIHTTRVSESGSTQLEEYEMAVMDDGLGDLGASGSVVYTTGVVDLEVVPGVPTNSWSEDTYWTYDSEDTNTQFLTGTVTARYMLDTATPAAQTVQIPLPGPVLLFGGDLIPDSLVPGSLRFAWNGEYYQDRGDGDVYRAINPVNGSGTAAGTIDYAAREVTLTDYVGGAGTVTVQSLLTRFGDWSASEIQFRTPGSPLRPSSFYVRATAVTGELLEGPSDVNGVIDAAEIQGTVQQDMGVVALRFGAQVLETTLTDDQRAEDWYDPADIQPDGTIWRPRPVLPGTIRFSTVVLATLPLDPSILGLDPVRLPSDGRVVVIRAGDVLVVHSTGSDALPDPVVADATYNLARGDLEALWIEDQEKDRVPTDQYTHDLVAGTVTMASVLDLGAYTQPLVVRHRQEDMVVCSDSQIDGTLSLSAPLNHAYDTSSYVSSALLFGDLQARVANVFDQSTWTGVWSDSLIGSQANAEYDDINYPVETDNLSAVKDRLRINFTSSTAFQLYSENMGQIATGNTSTDLTPVNPVTGAPYFTVRAAGWGGGWSAGNQLRFNIEAGSAPAWAARTILQNAALTEDAIRLERRGDVD